MNESANSTMTVKGTFWLRASHSEMTPGSPGFTHTVDHTLG